MTIALDVFDCYPPAEGTCGRQQVNFRFKLANTASTYTWDIDWDTVHIYFKADGGTYEAIVDDGAVADKHSDYVLFCKSMITANTFAANQWACGHAHTQGAFVWDLPAGFPDGKTYWLKIEFDDTNGSSYSEEWWFTTAAASDIGPRKLRWLDTSDNKATQRFGICPYGGTVSIPARLSWAADNPYAPTAYHLWVEPLHIPTETTVRLKIANRAYMPVTGTWIKITFDPNDADGLPIPAQGYIDVELQLTSNSADSKPVFVSLAFHVYGKAIANQFAASSYAANGIAKMDRLKLDFSAELFSKETGDYFRDTLGISMEAS
ncbi:MAG: hypothetical protein JRI80_00175 [Deltaproteobacteria bacterium]|nr:hypothetical protein [Deltaproteobacteria bacterium]